MASFAYNTEDQNEKIKEYVNRCTLCQNQQITQDVNQCTLSVNIFQTGTTTCYKSNLQTKLDATV